MIDKSDAKKGEKWVLHFSGDDWWRPQVQSRHHLMREFYKKGYNILWINPIPLRFPSPKKSGFTKKIVRKTKSISKTLRKNKEGFYVYSSIFLPFFKRGLMERINATFIKLQLYFVMQILRIKEFSCFVSTPTFAPVINSYRRRSRLKRIIYYYTDQYDKYREIGDSRSIKEWDQVLQEDADAIYSASEAILENIPKDYQKSKKVRLLEHQVDFDLFDYKNVRVKKLPIKPPIIGYFGSLTDSNDWEMIRYAANLRPKWNFVFIGEKEISLPELESLPNVFFLGYVPYLDLPSIAINFTVGIMLWKMTDWIKACSPLKLKEYLALGLPVVSVPIDEIVKKYAPFVEFCTDGPSFIKAVQKSLKRPSPEQARKFARSFSWSNAVDEIIEECHL